MGQTKRNLPIGYWRTHSSFIRPFAIEKLDGLLYVACSNGIYTHNPATGEYEIIDKINGLTGVGITAFRKHPARNLFLIGYEDGSLDVMEGSKIFSLKDISNTNLVNDKRINNIRISGNLAYVSTNFGVVVYNLSKREVRDFNYTLGATGNSIPVFDCLQFKDSIFARTTEGLKNISVRSDFRNTSLWKILNSPFPLVELPGSLPLGIELIDSLDGKFFIGFAGGFSLKNEAGSERAYRLAIPIGGLKRGISNVDTNFFVFLTDNIVQFSNDLKKGIDTLDKVFDKKITLPLALVELEGFRYLCDGFNGIIKLDNKNNFLERLLPNGLWFETAFSLGQFKDKIILNSGGYTLPSAGNANYNDAGFAVFENNEWRTLLPTINVRDREERIRDFSSTYYDANSQKLFQTSFGCGVVEFDANDLSKYQIYNDVNTNGGICNFFFDCIYNYLEDRYINQGGNLVEADPFFVRTTFAAIDLNGDKWVGNYLMKSAIRIQNAQTGEWRSLTLPFDNGDSPLGILIDQSGYKWIRMAPLKSNGNAGLWVLNNDGSRRQALIANEKQGNLPSNDVYDIAEDKSGYIWVGTGKGLCVYYNPINAFAPGSISASTPIFPPEAGRPVLENDVVTSIEIDGANRKWIGTRNSGIWLFNADITQLISHFTLDNSPLISNNIYDLAINKPTGELFIATDKGLVSYQTDASENIDEQGRLADEDCSAMGVNVFPNPVKKDYSGLIAINGLASNSIVKFVTASGKLVYQTNAKGGMATWNGLTYDGKKAHPGIYLILASSEDGKANCFSKLAILD